MTEKLAQIIIWYRPTSQNGAQLLKFILRKACAFWMLSVIAYRHSVINLCYRCLGHFITPRKRARNRTKCMHVGLIAILWTSSWARRNLEFSWLAAVTTQGEQYNYFSACSSTFSFDAGLFTIAFKAADFDHVLNIVATLIQNREQSHSDWPLKNVLYWQHRMAWVGVRGSECFRDGRPEIAHFTTLGRWQRRPVIMTSRRYIDHSIGQ
jgi:hypothetical protein